nr:hypothetical protein [Tanacetum cinerariifolium]
MDDMNIPANDAPAEQAPTVAPPTRTDDQILSSSKWVPIGKSNCVLDVQKSQRNLIFSIVVAILKNTNFFRAFTASFTIPAIYIQQFWDTMCFNSSTRLYSYQLDEQWFNLHKDILKDALDITPTNDNNPFVAPPSSDIVIEYVNTLGYPSTLKNVSAMSILWGIIHSSNIDYGERIWEEFVQSIQTFLTNRKNLAMASRRKKKTAHLLIPTVREIFDMQILGALLTDEIKGAPYYEEGEATKSPKVTKVTKPKATKGGLVRKIRKPISSLKLVDEPAYNEEEANLQRALELSLKEQAEQTQGPSHLVVIREPDSGRIQSLPGVQGKGKEKRRTLMPTKAFGPGESPSLDAKLTLTDSEIESDDVVPKINTRDQDKGQAEPNRGEQAVDEIVTDTVDWAMQAPFRARFTHEDHKKLYDALEKSLERDYSDQLLSDLEEACQKKRKRRDVPRTPSGSPPPQPPPPPPPAGASGAPGSKALSLSKSAALVSQSMAWTRFDIRYESVGLSETQELSPTDSLILDDSIPDEQATALVSAYETPAKNSLFTKTGDMTNFLNWYCRQVNKIMLTPSDLEGQAYEVVKAFYPDVIHLHKGSSLALSISKMKAASYPDFGLELLVPEQMWIDDVCTYDTSTKYGISYWWFNRPNFYINRHASPSRRKEVRSTIWILSVVIIKAYSRYGYDYLSEIVL